MLITSEEQLVEARRRISELEEKLQNYYSVADVEAPCMLKPGVKRVFSQPIPATKIEARTRQNLVLVCMCVLLYMHSPQFNVPLLYGLHRLQH